MPILRTNSFTSKAPGIANILSTPILVHLPLEDHQSNLPDNYAVFRGTAIWDTGATGSVITTKIIQSLNLSPISTAICNGVHGPKRVNVYMVGMELPNRVGIKSIRVTESSELVDGFDMLIGMDIINRGDFAISNFNGLTQFTFRMPSCESFDFVNNKPIQKPIVSGKKQLRNERCSCGSGRKYKDCCGKN